MRVVVPNRADGSPLPLTAEYGYVYELISSHKGITPENGYIHNGAETKLLQRDLVDDPEQWLASVSDGEVIDRSENGRDNTIATRCAYFEGDTYIESGSGASYTNNTYFACALKPDPSFLTTNMLLLGYGAFSCWWNPSTGNLTIGLGNAGVGNLSTVVNIGSFTDITGWNSIAYSISDGTLLRVMVNGIIVKMKFSK